MEELLYPAVACVAFVTGRLSVRIRRRRKPRENAGLAAYQAYKERQ